MRVGITYDLRADYLAAGFGDEETAEFDRDSTIDAIEAAVRSLGHDTERVGNVYRLVSRLSAGDNWDLVFNIAEGLYGFGREAQVPSLLDAFEIPYTFSDPLVMTVTLHKAAAKRILRDLGVRTADFAVVQSEADVAKVDLPFPLFVKPVAEGTAKGIHGQSRVSTRAELERACADVLGEFRQPALVEVYLPGREFTVGITGTGETAVAVGTLEIRLREEADPHAYTYRNKEFSEELCDFPLADPAAAREAEALALEAWRGLGCRDAGRVDIRTDADGRLCVMEINPIPGLHPTHSDLPMLCTAVGMPYAALIGRIVGSATERVRAKSADAAMPPPHRAGRPDVRGLLHPRSAAG